jgi:hypothetical protein
VSFVEERFHLFLWLLAGASLFGLLGGAFGALAGAFARRSGSAIGGFVGPIVVASFERVSDNPLSPGLSGAVSGGSDGLLFLAALGLAIGGYAYSCGPDAGVIFLEFSGVALLLILATLCFAGLRWVLLKTSVRSLPPAEEDTNTAEDHL